MSDEPDFRALLARVRAREPGAAAELVRRYDPQIRRLIRVRLTDPKLRRLVDTADIFQSVLFKCLVHVSEGRYDLQDPAELLKLLATMVSHKIIDMARRPEMRKAAPGGGEPLDSLAGEGETPSAVLACRELLDKIAHLLSEEELRIVRLRLEGVPWAEIAAGEGREPDAVRKQHDRALQRVREQLGGDGPGHV